MKKILVNPADIESCWEKPDACMVKTKTGKVWVCEKKYEKQPTISIIQNAKNQYFIELPLKKNKRSAEEINGTS